ncbi:hypothetical protein SAY87_002444 [Trapa incisa]|uniref:Uncharacterized protein n=1 Tax=Trapa incisa TaxID=236973 RepID=A0AAN7PZK2_9MYRT|nr:hypothetical protein SAY87_002444 [Trapa incisa]
MKPSSSLLEAIDLIVQGAQNLLVLVQNKRNPRRKPFFTANPYIPTSTTYHTSYMNFCWLTQEEIIRLLLNSISLFSPLYALSIASLDLITTDFSALDYDSAATSTVEPIALSLVHQTSVSITDPEGALIGEISPLALACYHETLAVAKAT